MSTKNQSEDSGVGQPEREANQEDNTDIQTLQDRAPEFNHELEVIASVPTSKVHQFNQCGERIEGEYGKPGWEYLSVDSARCLGCNKEFESEAEGKRHQDVAWRQYSKKYLLPQPTKDSSSAYTPLSFTGEEIEISGFATGIPHDSRSAALVTDGIEYLIATSRRSLTPPRTHNLDSWAPLNGGVLCYPDGAPRVNPELVEAALIYLSPTNGRQFRPERYTLFDRGDEPMVVTGCGSAIAIARKITNKDTFEESQHSEENQAANREEREALIEEIKELAETHDMEAADVGGEIRIGQGEDYGVTIYREFS